MDIAVVGEYAQELCRAADIGAQPFSTLHAASDRRWELLALTSPSVRLGARATIFADILLLPGDSDPSLLREIRTLQIVSYGFSPRDTLTLSSLAGDERLVCLQRSLLSPGGVLLEPQEFPLSASLAALPGEQALLVAGVRLLCS